MDWITIGAASHIGMRKRENQDYYAACPPEKGRRHEKGLLLTLADGMGGHSGGAIASKTAVDTLMNVYYQDDPWDIRQALLHAYQQANAAILKNALENRELAGMGTTMTSVVIRKNRLYFGHVGDSRAYLIRNSAMRQLTEDHSYVAELVKAGVIRPEEANHHPQNNIITRAVGYKTKLTVDSSDKPVKLKQSDFILICCDGLYRCVTDDEILQTVLHLRDPGTICTKLVERANENGGHDNITVMIARLNVLERFSGFKRLFSFFSGSHA